MAIAPIDMLRRLGSGVRTGPSRTGDAIFAGVAGRVRRETARGRSVRISHTLMGIELSDKRLAQMSIAADSAEAAGARTLLTIDNQGTYVIDLATRIIERARQLPQGANAQAMHPSEANATNLDQPTDAVIGIRETPVNKIAGVLVGVDAVAVLPHDEEEPVERLFAAPDGLLDASGTANADHLWPTSVCNASIAHLLAARTSGSAGDTSDM